MNYVTPTTKSFWEADPDCKLSIVYHNNEYYVYQGVPIKGDDLIIKGQDYSWTVLKSIYDNPLVSSLKLKGKEIDVGMHIKFGRVCFRVKETSESIKRENQDVLESWEIFDNTNTEIERNNLSY